MALPTFLARALNNTVESKGQEHFARPHGSFIEGVDRMDGDRHLEILSQCDWIEEANHPAKFGSCRYFVGALPQGVQGMEAFARLGDLSSEELASVTIGEASHRNNDGSVRYELRAPLKGAEVSFATLVVGDPENPSSKPGDSAIVYMWAPGRLLPLVEIPSSELDIEAFASEQPDATVKAEG
jgi:hypothetical protein